MKTSIRIVIADDHPLVRSGIRMVVTAESDMEVVGEANDGFQAQEVCAGFSPDVILLDVSMPGPPLTEVIRYFKSNCSDMKILVVSAYDDDAYIRTLVDAGIAGYMLKDEAPELVVDAIRSVMGGAAWFSRSVLQTILSHRNEAHSVSPLTELTDRELEVLGGIAQGWSNAHIAQELHLAEQTVRNYTSRIYEKISVTSRTEAVLWARDRNIGVSPL